MLRAILACLTLLLACCASPYETLRTAQGERPALRAAIARPEGPGPFPTVVLLHGAMGVLPNSEQWRALLVGAGYLVAIPDQYGPRGIAQTAMTANPNSALPARIEDSVALIRLLQARPDVRADRVFAIGFSQGGTTAGILAGEEAWTRVEGRSAPPRLRGAVALYASCTNWPVRLEAPVLIVAGGADDWTPARFCRGMAEQFPPGRQPRYVELPGAHHGFDDVFVNPPRYMPAYRNGFAPGGYGATVGYDAGATAAARREVMDFLRALR